MIVPARHPPGSPGPPRPDHRRDIMNQRQGLAAAAQSVGDAPTEPGAVDCHDSVGPQLADSGDRCANPSQDDSCPRQHLGHTPDRKVLQWCEARQTTLLHALPADPGDPEITPGTLLQCRDQSGAKGVTGGFAGDEEDKQRRLGYGHEGLMPTTNSPAASAARITSSRSRTIVPPASTAMPSRRASAARV